MDVKPGIDGRDVEFVLCCWRVLGAAYGEEKLGRLVIGVLCGVMAEPLREKELDLVLMNDDERDWEMDGLRGFGFSELIMSAYE